MENKIYFLEVKGTNFFQNVSKSETDVSVSMKFYMTETFSNGRSASKKVDQSCFYNEKVVQKWKREIG